MMYIFVRICSGVKKESMRTELLMKGFTDIHNHILFGVDDGAKTIEDSIALIQDEYAQGVRKIIITPHFQGGVYETDNEIICERFNVLKKAVAENYPDMELYLGNEILFTEDIVELINRNKINTLANSKYVLVEFVPSIRYGILEKNIKDVLISGFIPIIAHAERYECLIENVKRVEHLVETGAYVQINAKSVFSFGYKKIVKKLIGRDCVHFVASDAHDIQKRGVHFDKCIKYLTKKYGEEYVDWLLIENPQKVIDNQYI